MKASRLLLSFVCILLTIPAVTQSSKTKKTTIAKKLAPTITVAVDATQAARKIFHSRMTLPVAAGTLTLYYPKWIPGEHGPTGPIQDLTGLKFTANGKELKWRRDLPDGWTFHVEVPPGVNDVIAQLDYASPATLQAGFGAGSAATDKLYVVN